MLIHNTRHRPLTYAHELHLRCTIGYKPFLHNQLPVLLEAPWRHSLLSATRTQGRLETILGAAAPHCGLVNFMAT